MTGSEKDEIAGRTRREYREARAELAALQKKASETGKFLVQFGDILAREPENVIFAHDSYDVRFTAKGNLLNDAQFAEFTPERIRSLTGQIRDQILKIDGLRRRIAELEGEDPERR